MSSFVQINSVLSNLFCVWILRGWLRPKQQLNNSFCRLYEEYWANSVALEYEPSADDFNTRVVWKLDVLRTCLRTQPLRTCVYDGVQESRDSSVSSLQLMVWGLSIIPDFNTILANQTAKKTCQSRLMSNFSQSSKNKLKNCQTRSMSNFSHFFNIFLWKN